MLKAVTGLAAVLVVAGAAVAQESTQEPAHREPPREDTHQSASAQETTHQSIHRRLSQADLNALTDARIGMARAMLQLTPEQARFWPPIEEAMRNSAEARYRRIAQRRAMADRDGEREHDPVATMRSRAEALSERGAQLRKLADAWQPLCQTLNPEQKDRLRLVMSHVLRDTRGAMGRRMSDHPGGEEGEED